MVSFVCDTCQETLKKAKLDQHSFRCRNAQFSCIDCYKTFQGTEYRAHTTCITEDQKVQGKLYKPKQQQQQYQNKNIAAVKPASTNTITPTSCIAKEPTSSLSLIDQIKEKTVAAAAKDTSLEEPSKSEEDGEMSSLTKKRKATTEEAVSSPTKQKKKNKKSKKRSSEEDSSAAAGVVDANGDAVGVVDGWDESTWSFTSKAEGVKAAIRRVLSKESNGFTFSTLSSKVVELIMANPAHPFKKESKITKFMNENTNIKLGADGTTMEMHVME